jgi:hypothetical protein
MAATVIHRLTLDPMGKCSNAFFSETTNIRGPCLSIAFAFYLIFMENEGGGYM